MRRFIVTIAVTAAFVLGGQSSALAEDPQPAHGSEGYQPRGSECGQYHGAFGYYAHQNDLWIPDGARDPNHGTGPGLGDKTGPANSAKGCQNNF